MLDGIFFISAIFKTYGGDIRNYIDIKEEECKDPTGCICGNDPNTMQACWPYIYGGKKNEETKENCLDPITPVGSCEKICGEYGK